MVRTQKHLAVAGTALLAFSLALPVTSAQAASNKPQRSAAPADLLVMTTPTTVSFCWSGGVGQRVNLTTTVDGFRRVLAVTTLVKDRRCPKDHPLAARYRVTPPTTAGKYPVFEEVVAGKGFKANRLFAFNLGIPGNWTAAQRECIDYLWAGPQRDQVVRSGPGLSPPDITNAVASCEPRLTQYSQAWLDAAFNSYLVASTSIPDARRQLVTGALGEATFKQLLIDESKRQFPGLVPYISSTRTTTDIFQTLRDIAESNFETTIPDLSTDPLMRTWIIEGIPATRQAAETAIRQDSRWEYTKRGRLSYLALAAGLLCAFGQKSQCDVQKRYEAELAKLPPILPRWPIF